MIRYNVALDEFIFTLHCKKRLMFMIKNAYPWLF